MTVKPKARKRRSDRNHIIYRITNNVTGETYIGVTVMKGQAINRSLKIRWEAHLKAALEYGKPWVFPTNIRQHGAKAFSREVIEIIRGKASAFKREAELINTLNPTLNTKRQGVNPNRESDSLFALVA